MFRAVHRVFARILLLAAAAVLSLVAVGYFVLTESRNNLYEQKKADIRHIVEAAVTIVADFDKRAKSGEMTQEQAQAQVLKALTALRYGNDDYVFIYDLKGNLVLNPLKPEIKGQNRFDVRDPNGVYYVREFIRLAKSGGGHLTYGYEMPATKEVRDKLSYITGYLPWDWFIASGVLLEDVDAMNQRMIRNVLVCLGLVATILLIAVFAISRSIVNPLGRLTGSLQQLAAGEVDAEVKGVERRDEFGTIARAVLGVRDAVRGRMQEQMQHEEEAKGAAEAERRRVLAEIAQSLDRQVKAVTDTVAQAANELVSTAQSMDQVSATARRRGGRSLRRQHAGGEPRRDGRPGDRPARQRHQRDQRAGERVGQDVAGRGEPDPGSERHRAQPVGSLRRHRQGGVADPGDRRADQPAGAQRHDRGGAGRRGGARLCGGGLGGEAAGDADVEGDRRDHRSDRSGARGDRQGGVVDRGSRPRRSAG